ncbi:MAG: PepSY-associated TM helix domain-containing protein [Nitrospira sp.]|nr:PepSY-associated TM helix domain-containing protein [Nitrospira sp.]
MLRSWINRDALARLNMAVHRDIGYTCASLILAYCISGIAVNHVGDWNPDFVITKQTVSLPHPLTREQITPARIEEFGRLVKEESYKIYDFPTADQVKIYYDNASLHVNLTTGEGMYEKVSRRPLLYHVNALHLNRLQGWKWVSDVFAFVLIILSLTGLFILRGKHGLARRGKWLVMAGLLPPIVALLIFELK